MGNIKPGNLLFKAKAYIRENHYLKSHLGKAILRRKLSLKFPSDLYIEPTNSCNLSCSMCPRKLSSKKTGHMDFELFKKIVDESVQYGQREVITLHKDGEPLLHPELTRMIAYANEKKAARILRFSTNAQLLDEVKCQELILSGLDAITISLDGTSEETYKNIRGGDYHKVVNNALHFIKTRNGMGRARPWVTLQVIKMRDTLPQVESFIERWKPIADEVAVKDFLNWGGAIPGDYGVTSNPDSREPCSDLWMYLAINWDGKVSICCLDFDGKCIVGDVRDQSLKEVWHSKELSQYRLSHLNRLWQRMPMCKDCNVWHHQLPLWNRRMEEKYRHHALRALDE